MRYPKMIIFDYGHTLLYEPGFDALRGEKALFEYITENPRGITPEQANRFVEALFSEFGRVREAGFEIHEYPILRLMNEYFGLRFSVPVEEAEIIFWEGASRGALMPGADRMLDFINENGIRSGVVSNISFSARALQSRINRLLPRNRFEFVIASSEYMIRKPNRLLFELALRKAGLSAEEAWFCGDHPQADVEGAARVGIFPVWYENATERDYKDRSGEMVPSCEHLHIHEWHEMITALEKLQGAL